MITTPILRKASPMSLDFDDFFRDEYPRLLPLLQAVVGDRGHAEDIAQEALAAAQRAWAKVGRYDRPGAWVRRVALNRASNVRRRRGREVVALGRIGVASGVADAPTTADQRLWRLVRELPEQQRHAVALHYVEDRSLSDIARIIGCSEGTVKSYLSRARATLARRLNDSGKEATS